MRFLFPFAIRRFFAFCFDKELDRLNCNEALFAELFGVSRGQALAHLNAVLKHQGIEEYCEDRGMFSEHLLIFSAIAIKDASNVANILEIGTYDGFTAKLLALLFAEASVTTIDLPQDDGVFRQSYGRDSDRVRLEFVCKRDENLCSSSRINFLEQNSIRLLDMAGVEYDLIWVDGAHGVPIVVSDLTNAYRLLSDDGACLVDDVLINVPNENSLFRSRGAFLMLKELEAEEMVQDLSFFFKRLGWRFCYLRPIIQKIGFFRRQKSVVFKE